MKIPGVTFSWERALGISKIKQIVARATVYSKKKFCNRLR
jgi:hypothetical protein